MSTPNTFSFMLCDDVVARLKYFPFFKDFKFSRTKAHPIQVDDIPYCGVYFLNELQLPDGDANEGRIRFRTSVRVGFSVIVQNNYPDVAERRLDQALYAIENGLFCDPSFYIGKIQGFTRGERNHVFGSVGHDQETPVAELQFDLTCDLGVIDYDPIIPDILETVHIDARPLLNPHAPLIEMEWTIETNGAANGSKNQGQAKPRRAPAASKRRPVTQGRWFVDR